MSSHRSTTRTIRRWVARRRPASNGTHGLKARRASDEARERYACELVDDHGETLFRLAWVISGDCAAASSAVVRVIVAAAQDHGHLEPAGATLFELGRLTMWASLAPSADAPLADKGHVTREANAFNLLRGIPPHERALVGLTIFGNHTYREAAVVLGLDPPTAAQLVRSTLHALAGGDAPHGTETQLSRLGTARP